jgi:hypothetical protein
MTASIDEAILRSLHWEPAPDTLARFRETSAAKLQAPDPYTAVDYARFAVKRAQAVCKRRRRKRRRAACRAV